METESCKGKPGKIGGNPDMPAVGLAMERLDGAIASVGETTDMLINRTAPVCRPCDGKDAIGERMGSPVPVADEIDRMTLQVESVAADLKDLLDRMEI